MVKRIILIIIILILGIGAGLTVYFTSPVDSNDNKVIKFNISSEENTDSILNRLAQEDLIHNQLFAKIYVKLGNRSDFKAGSFELEKSFSLSQILTALSNPAASETTNITFIEGYWITDFAKVAYQQLGINQDEFLRLCNDKEFIDQLSQNNELLKNYNFSSKEKYLLEGLLAPDTYTVDTSINAKQLIEILTDQSNKVYQEMKKSFDKSKLSLREIYTLASLVEGEVRTYDSRLIVASIFINRLNDKMSLGSDVSTYYGIQVKMGERDLTVDELNEDNGYNTRSKMIGLPYGPIGASSVDSLKAVLNAPKTKYLYFVTDKNGKLYPSKTDAEHNKIIEDLKAKGLWFTFE